MAIRRKLPWRAGAWIGLSLAVIAALCLWTHSGYIAGRDAPTSTPPFGGYLVLDGWDDYAEAEDHPELDVGIAPGGSLTVEAWVLLRSPPPAYPKDFGIIINKNGAYQILGTWSPPRITFGLDSDPESWAMARDVTWDPGWHHVAEVYDWEAGQLRGYMDGMLLGDPWNIGQHAVQDSPWWLRVSEWGPASAWPGKIDEVRISDVARYKGETYQVPTSPFVCDEHTRALYHFDEIEGSTLFHDACGADNLLKGVGGAHTEGVKGHRVWLPFVAKRLLELLHR